MTLANFVTGFIGALCAVFLIQVIHELFHPEQKEYRVNHRTIEEIDRLLHADPNESTVNINTGFISYQGKNGEQKAIKINSDRRILKVTFTNDFITVDSASKDGPVESEEFMR